MFHPSRLIDAQNRISEDLKEINTYDSVKLYLCWYDEFLVSKEDFNGNYPCSKNKVSLTEVIAIINVVFKKPCIIRHNVYINPLPIGLSFKADIQDEIEKYVEVCLIKNL